MKTAIQAVREPQVRGSVPVCGLVPFLGAETHPHSHLVFSRTPVHRSLQKNKTPGPY